MAWACECAGSTTACIGSKEVLSKDSEPPLNLPLIHGMTFLSVLHLLSKFIPRGSVRVLNVVLGSTLEATAFLTPDQQVVVVVMNRGDQPVTFKLLDNIGGKLQAVQISAVAHSIQTFLYT